jgi:hypothetical protein
MALPRPPAEPPEAYFWIVRGGAAPMHTRRGIGRKAVLSALKFSCVRGRKS